MSAFRTAALLLSLATTSLLADERAGSMTILPPPPTQMDWHAGNRTWNLEGARHIHFPMPSHGDRDHGGRDGRRFHSFAPRFLGHPYGRYGYGYSSFGYPGYGYSGYYGPGYSYYQRSYIPLTGLDYAASLLYANQAVTATLEAHRRGRAAAQAAPRRAQPPMRASLPQAKARARGAEQKGDIRFREQKYRRAYELYRSARRAAPDRADVHFRIAQTMVALGRYTSAVTAIQRGIRVDPTWPESDFDLHNLYGDDDLVLLSHIERVAMALRDNMDNPDLLFLLGYQLYFTGHRERARPFFERAEQLVGDATHILPFLDAGLDELPLPDKQRDREFDSEPAPAPPEVDIPNNGTRREI